MYITKILRKLSHRNLQETLLRCESTKDESENFELDEELLLKCYDQDEFLGCTSVSPGKNY